MITKDNVKIHLVKTVAGKAKKPVLKGHVAVDGFAVQKLIGWQSKADPNRWVVSEDGDDYEGKPLFTFFENSFENKLGEDSFTLKTPSFTIYGLTFPLSGFLGYKYPKYDQWGNEMYTCTMEFDENTYEYYNEKEYDKYPKNYVLENKKITLDEAELEILEKNSYKEFITLKETIFAGRVVGTEANKEGKTEAKAKPAAKKTAKSKAKPF